MLGIWHCNIIAELPAPGYREQDQGTDRDRDRDRNMDTNTDTLCWIAKTELNVVWLWGSLGALHYSMQNYRSLNTVSRVSTRTETETETWTRTWTRFVGLRKLNSNWCGFGALWVHCIMAL